MKVSYEEELATRFGLRWRGDPGNGIVLSVRLKGNTGMVLSSEITLSVCRSCPDREKATSSLPLLARHRRTRRSLRPIACVDIPNARTGRSVWFPVASGRDESCHWNGQREKGVKGKKVSREKRCQEPNWHFRRVSLVFL